MNIIVKCDTCNSELDIISEYVERGELYLTIQPCPDCIKSLEAEIEAENSINLDAMFNDGVVEGHEAGYEEGFKDGVESVEKEDK